MPKLRASFDSDDPQERTLALAAVARNDDRSHAVDVVKMLDSPDPAHRMLAIGILERWTGQTLGYDYAGDERSRREAAARWEQWVVDSGQAPR